tara:strand:+ start:7403 stop:8422 length:1020 start_codon:yes stop_codon:yes gene_type:complete
MSAEESKLVEEVVETSEATETKEVKDEFNPLAFSEDVYGEIGKTTEAIEEAVEVEEKSEEEEDKEKEDGWGWDSEKEEDSQEDKEEEYNWEEEKKEEKETASEKGLSWNEVGKEIGLDVSNKEEFLKTLNAYAEQLQAQSNAPAPSSQITELRSYLSFSDRDLVGEELKADGIEASDIEDSLDKLEDSGMMKMKAKSIRRVIGNAIDTQTNDAKQQQVQSQQKQQQEIKNAKQKLKEEVKNMSEFMGGKVTKKQKEEVYRYATGSMMKDIYADHANVADVAMFMLYRKQIEKILRSQGLEDGKASIMDSIVSPNLNTGKSKSDYKIKSGKFDPKAFMNE